MTAHPSSIVHLSFRDVRRRIGDLVIVGFAGLEVPAELDSMAREFGVGGTILFARNIESPQQVADLSREIRALARDQQPWVSVDQEGGRVARLRAPFTEWPPMAALGRSGDAILAERFARALAAELTAVGINLDFAPVLDIHSNPNNPVIGDRAISDQPEIVARLGAVIIRTLQENGLAACGKHFPGHGDTSVDSHLELPLVEHPPDRFDRVELAPFRAAIAAGVASIMTAHVLAPAFDEERPATLSSAIVQGLLRHRLAFGGLIVSDDLYMGAIARRYSIADAARLAIEAGCDAVLLCEPKPDEHAAVLEALVYAVEDGRLPKRRVEEALGRQDATKERFLRGPSGPISPRALRDLLGRSEHAAVADELARYS